MLAAPRTKTVREAEKVLLVNLVEDGDHGVLDNLVLHRRNPQWALPPISFLYVNSSRGRRSEHSAMHPAVQIDQAVLQFGFILLPRYAVGSGCCLSLQRVKAFP